MKILIADDSKAMRIMLRQCLRQAGYGHAQIVEAASGREAAKKIQQGVPHMVLTDWNMEDIGGHQLLVWLQKSKYKGVSGVVTAAATAEMRKQARDAGATFVIVKPFTPEDFRQALESVGFRGSETTATSDTGGAMVWAFDAQGVSTSLRSAFRPDMTITEGVALGPTDGPFTCATYLSDGQASGYAVLEPLLALYLGTALMLIPAGQAQEAVRGTIPPNLRDNVGEVCNLLVRMFAQATGGAVSVGQIAFKQPTLPSAEGARVVGLRVQIKGYGEGRMTLILNPAPTS